MTVDALRAAAERLAQEVDVARTAEQVAVVVALDDLGMLVDAFRFPVRYVMPAGPPPSPEDLRRALLAQPILVEPPGHRLTDEEAELASSALAERAIAEQVAGREQQAREAFALAERLARTHP